jgi:hypothetical protein
MMHQQTMSLICGKFRKLLLWQHGLLIYLWQLYRCGNLRIL